MDWIGLDWIFLNSSLECVVTTCPASPRQVKKLHEQTIVRSYDYLKDFDHYACILLAKEIEKKGIVVSQKVVLIYVLTGLCYSLSSCPDLSVQNA